MVIAIRPTRYASRDKLGAKSYHSTNDLDRQTDRQTETETDRDRQTETDRDRQTGKERQTDRHRHRHRNTDTSTEKSREIETKGETDTQRDRHMETYRGTEIKGDRHGRTDRKTERCQHVVNFAASLSLTYARERERGVSIQRCSAFFAAAVPLTYAICLWYTQFIAKQNLWTLIKGWYQGHSPNLIYRLSPNNNLAPMF